MQPCDCVPPGCMLDGSPSIFIGPYSSVGAKIGQTLFPQPKEAITSEQNNSLRQQSRTTSSSQVLTVRNIQHEFEVDI